MHYWTRESFCQLETWRLGPCLPVFKYSSPVWLHFSEMGILFHVHFEENRKCIEGWNPRDLSKCNLEIHLTRKQNSIMWQLWAWKLLFFNFHLFNFDLNIMFPYLFLFLSKLFARQYINCINILISYHKFLINFIFWISNLTITGKTIDWCWKKNISKPK